MLLFCRNAFEQKDYLVPLLLVHTEQKRMRVRVHEFHLNFQLLTHLLSQTLNTVFDLEDLLIDLLELLVVSRIDHVHPHFRLLHVNPLLHHLRQLRELLNAVLKRL